MACTVVYIVEFVIYFLVLYSQYGLTVKTVLQNVPMNLVKCCKIVLPPASTSVCLQVRLFLTLAVSATI